MKKFLISIDTEGDNLWKWKIGDRITTENSKYLPRFQELCEKYGFIPTYLTNLEMCEDKFFSEYFKLKADQNLCEIGMHLHAWNSPPDYNLSVRTDVMPGAPFLVEYPTEIMSEKVNFLTERLENVFERKMLVHRAGRWAIDERYIKILAENGYKIDCSVTPSINWNKAAGQSPESMGTDFSQYSKQPYLWENSGVLEVPVTIRENHRLRSLKGCGIRKGLAKIIEAKNGYGPLWLRPRNSKENLEDLLYLTDLIYNESKTDYLMFMLHSSEFMPGGSPSFPNNESIENLFSNLEILFEYISKKFIGVTFETYYEKYE